MSISNDDLHKELNKLKDTAAFVDITLNDRILESGGTENFDTVKLMLHMMKTIIHFSEEILELRDRITALEDRENK